MIELLVVIAIIAILAAILFPVFAEAREAAKGARAISDMQQIAYATQLYATDYDDQITPWRVSSGKAKDMFRNDRNTWVTLLYPYTKSGMPKAPKDISQFSGVNDPNFMNIPAQGVFNSPLWTAQKWHDGGAKLDCDGAMSQPTWDQYSLPVHWEFSGYGLTFYQIGPDANTSADDGGPGCTFNNPYYALAGGDGLLNETSMFTQIVRADQTALITDGFTGLTSDTSVLGGDGSIPLQTGTFGCESANFIHGGGNIAFMDSHAKFVRGNSERYLDTDSEGCVFKHYYTFDR